MPLASENPFNASSKLNFSHPVRPTYASLRSAVRRNPYRTTTCPRETASNFQLREDEQNEDAGSPGTENEVPASASVAGPSSPAPCTAPRASKKRRSSANTYEQSLLIYILSKKSKAEEIDEDKSFLLSFLPALKRMPPERKFQVKMELMKVIHTFDRPVQA
ncbi:hypothetical protein ElyMa_002649900 [Elysia marginata]|uniref:BESS domain-containing protein n=1 Tax=Elysia marginata TaxID=1093978 RepID=A0AAV4H7G4_9GAST|nr:hypothetical protein ElyMa_002649900 [Elysia marginata]